jgi:hypothetical protein
MVVPGTMVTTIDLGSTNMNELDIGIVPIVSAGAITHGVLYTLLRVPELAGTAVVFDDDLGDVPNLNRYSLMSAVDLGCPKAEGLQRWSTSNFQIQGYDRRYVAGAALGSERLLVGADDIAIRWAAQRDQPAWLGVGATSHLFAEVSTHSLHTACVGCVHDHEDDVPGVIPTISVVSAWCGLVLASELLGTLGCLAAGRRIWSFPLGLAGRHGHTVLLVKPNDRCPVRCAASRDRRARSA